MDELYHTVQLSLSLSPDVPTKPCSVCKLPKPYDAFGRDKHRSDGYEVRCKECLRKRGQELYVINRERRLETKRQDHIRHKEERNAKGRAVNQQYHELHKDQVRERGRLWEINNPERRREKWRRYNGRKILATVGQVSYDAILERDGMYCYICEQTIDSTITKRQGKLAFDHVIPLSRNGPHCNDNIKPTHSACNDRKGTRLLEEMDTYQRRGVL